MKHPLPGSMRRVRDRLSAVAAVGLILLPVIAQAAEGEAGHAAEHHAPSPWGLIYPFINFAIYSFVLWRYAWPAVRDYLSDRRANTLSALEAAKSVRAEAEALKAEYDAKLRNLEVEAARAREEVLATAQVEARNILEQAQKSADRIRKDSRLVADEEVARARRTPRRGTRFQADRPERSGALREGFRCPDALRRRRAWRFPMTGALAKRYARALLAVASDQGRVEETAAELGRTAVWLADPELGGVLASPMLGAKARAELLASIATSLDLSALMRDFLAVLAEKGRIAEFGLIDKAFEAMADESAGRVRATIRSPRAIDDAELSDLTGVLEKIAGRKVVPTVEIEPALIGGLTVEMQGTVYDGSVRTQLERLAQAMAKDAVAG